MDVMILAAGRGERMMPLTKNTPKPMLEICGRPLIEHQIIKLKNAGFQTFVINLGRFGEQIVSHLGTGESFGCHIEYSNEGENILETCGGIVKALPLIKTKTFLVVNADVWSDYDFRSLPTDLSGLVHLLLVDNPKHNREGDFCLENGLIQNKGENFYTYSGIGVYSQKFFQDISPHRLPLAPLLREACEQGQVSGELHQGFWMDIGTPERLNELETLLSIA